MHIIIHSSPRVLIVRVRVLEMHLYVLVTHSVTGQGTTHLRLTALAGLLGAGGRAS